jgi:hypothetical protein
LAAPVVQVIVSLRLNIAVKVNLILKPEFGAGRLIVIGPAADVIPIF